MPLSPTLSEQVDLANYYDRFAIYWKGGLLRLAHKKGGGTTKTNRDSISKRLGVKKFGGEAAWPGTIIVRQKGTKFYPGKGTRLGNDFTLYAIASGRVEFKKKLGKTLVNIV